MSAAAPITAVCLNCKAAWVMHPDRPCKHCGGKIHQLAQPLPNDDEHVMGRRLRDCYIPTEDAK